MNQDRINRDFENDDEITIDLGELLSALWSKAHLILLAGILAALVAFAGTQLLITPKYTSSTSMYMLSRTDSTSGLTNSDFQAGTQLTQDYMELVQSRAVLEQVISILNLDMTTEELADMVTTENTTDTRILTISVENEDPELAQQIADALRETASVKIQEIMEIDAVNTIEEANFPTEKSSPSITRNTVIGGALGILVAVAVIVLIFILDDTIRTPDDVEDYLGLNVLTSIPIQEGESKKVKKVKANGSHGSRRSRRASAHRAKR